MWSLFLQTLWDSGVSKKQLRKCQHDFLIWRTSLPERNSAGKDHADDHLKYFVPTLCWATRASDRRKLICKNFKMHQLIWMPIWMKSITMLLVGCFAELPVNAICMCLYTLGFVYNVQLCMYISYWQWRIKSGNQMLAILVVWLARATQLLALALFY